jgi:DNA-binding CsgD family transcriptional regulator
LADALTDQPERRAWQLAAAATGADERAANALAEAAEWARDRHGYAATAAALERSAELTADRVVRAERLVDAATAAADAGLRGRARSLMERGARIVEQPRLLARLCGLRARVAFEEGDAGSAHDLLLRGAAGIADIDRVAAGMMLVDAGRNAWQLSDPDRLLEAASRLRGLGLTDDDGLTPAMNAVVAAAAFMREGPGGALTVMRGLVTSARQIRTGATSVRINAAFVAGLTGDFAAGREISLAVADECRSQGAVGWLPLTHITLAAAELYLGRWRDAVATATEGLQIAADIGQPHRAGYLEGILAWVAAVSGDDQRCLAYAESCHDRFGENGIANGLAWAQWSVAMLELGAGRLAEALGRLDEAVRGPIRHQIQAVYFAPDQIEAAVRLGQPERANEPLARFRAWAEASTLDWAHAVLNRCRAVLEPDAETAHELYRAALALHADSGRPWEAARTYLLFGERLRRDRRIVEARDQLRHALEIFERLSAAPWAARARAELRAAGDISTARTAPDLLAALSPQELSIVRLAAGGLTNPEIGARLFLSAKTISYHLYRAFPKLNVTSRTQLARLDLTG